MTRVDKFYGLFVRLSKFWLQTHAMRCGHETPEAPSVRNAVQAVEHGRKSSFLNYESHALTAELQARRALTREHPTPNVQRPIVTEVTQVFSTLPPGSGKSLTISKMPDGAWAASQRWIAKGERFGLQTHIVMTGNVSLYVRMKS